MASKQILEEIRTRISIVSLVGDRLPLKKSGRNFKGLCPFHQEKTPSFMVSEEKQIYHCFGCQEGGDIFTFLMKIDGLTFPEALKELAQRVGVRLPEKEKGESRDKDAAFTKKKEWAFRLNALAKDYFCRTLASASGNGARQYLKNRGLSAETIQNLGIGFAPQEWEGLAAFLKSQNAPLPLAAELGLIKKRETQEGYFDFFRHRVIFPIRDLKGKVIAFGGRTLDEKEGAKYLNSPETLLYHKSNTFYGFREAAEAIRKKDEVFIVEGYMDWITLWQAGIQNVVAPCGTALTSEHLQRLRRTTQNIILTFDGDTAGTQAALRSLPLFLELALTPRLLLLPGGTDPDSFLKERGAQAFSTLQEKSPTLFEFFIDWTVQNSPKGTAGALQAWKKIEPLLQKIQDRVEKGIYLKRIAAKTGIEVENLKKNNKNNRLENKPASPLNEAKSYPEEERLLLAALVLKSKLSEKIRGAGEVFTHSRLKEISTQLFQILDEEGNVALHVALNHCDPPLASWIREMAMVEEEDQLWEKAVTDCLIKIKSRNLKTKLMQLNEEITLAEQAGNESTLLKLLTEKTKLMESQKGLAL